MTDRQWAILSEGEKEDISALLREGWTRQEIIDHYGCQRTRGVNERPPENEPLDFD